MADNPLISKYFTRPIVRQRNSVTLISWANTKSLEAIPSPADDPWVRVRVLAEAVPIALESYITQTLGYFAQDNITVTNIRQFLAEDNDDAAEVSLAGQNDSIIAAFAQRWANTVVSDQQVSDWRTRNNAPAPPPGQQGAKP